MVQRNSQQGSAPRSQNATENASHTPTPWQISDARTVDDTAMIVGGAGFEFGLIADVTKDFDAALIVKAVNSHQTLLARVARLEADLLECREFLENEVDVIDGDYGESDPNCAMKLVSMIDETLNGRPY